MNKPENEIEDLADRILAEAKIDWNAVSNKVRLDEADSIEGLKFLEDLMRGFRHSHVAAEAQRAQPVRFEFRFAGLEVRELLGSGSAGDIYRAYDPLLDQEVALKLRKPSSDLLSHRFLGEARKLTRIRHANIVSLYGAAVEDGRVGIWMELVRGETLEAALKRGTFSVEEVITVACDLCSALAVVHRHGLIHGDVKASNVLRETGGRTVLADFGSAREIGCEQDVVSTTQSYAAPEILAGDNPSELSDIYSLGVLLFRLLTGVYPLGAGSTEVRSKPVDIAAYRTDVPPSVRKAIESALNPSPKGRPSSARAFAAAMSPRSMARISAVAAASVAGLALLISFAAMMYVRGSLAQWHMSAEMIRVDKASTSPLRTGSFLHVGDLLALRIESSKPTYIYVFNADAVGRAAVLYPLNGQVAQALSAHEAITLPGVSSEGELSWQIDNDASSDEFVVLASTEPLPEVDELIKSWKRADEKKRSAFAVVRTPIETSLNNPDVEAIVVEAKKHHESDSLRTWRFHFPHEKKDPT